MQGILTRDEFAVFTQHLCCVVIGDLKVTKPTMLMHYSFLPFAWHSFSQGFQIEQFFHSPPKNASWKKLADTESTLALQLDQPPPNKEFQFFFLTKPLRVEGIHIGNKESTTVALEWKTKSGKNLLSSAKLFAKDGSVQTESKFDFIDEDKSNERLSLSDFLMTLPQGTLSVRLDTKGRKMSEAYLGSNPATAKNDYEIRLRGEQLKRRQQQESLK